jgi:co-chaperonin GroES (HSP10)
MKLLSLDGIWVKRLGKEKTEGGIILPEQFNNVIKEPMVPCEVVVIGDTIPEDQIGKLEVGDIVFVDKNGLTLREPVVYLGDKYSIIRTHDIGGFLKPAEWKKVNVKK